MKVTFFKNENLKKNQFFKFSKKTIPCSITLFCILMLFVSCSSAPKRAMLVTEISDSAARVYETANSEIISGQLDNAAAHLQQAYNLALSVDDTDLLCKISLSAVIYKLSLNGGGEEDVALNPVLQLAKKTDEQSSDTPFYGISAQTLLDMAQKYADRSNNKEVLSAVCPVYDVRIKLAQAQVSNSEELLKNLSTFEKKLSSEPYYLAFLKRTRGDLLAFVKRYSEAQKSYLEAASIHIKDRYVSEIGLDYYSAARMSSLSGDKNNAINYIQTALKYDKDAENTVAIAADYNAYGLILLKGNVSLQDKQKAREVILWAASIYKSGGFESESDSCKKYAESL